MSPIIATAVQCLRDEAQALLDLIPSIGSEFQLAVELILQCRGKVIVTGVGKSGHIGAKIAATLSSTGTPSFFINPLLKLTDNAEILNNKNNISKNSLVYIP